MDDSLNLKDEKKLEFSNLLSFLDPLFDIEKIFIYNGLYAYMLLSIKQSFSNIILEIPEKYPIYYENASESSKVYKLVRFDGRYFDLNNENSLELEKSHIFEKNIVQNSNHLKSIRKITTSTNYKLSLLSENTLCILGHNNKLKSFIIKHSIPTENENKELYPKIVLNNLFN